MTPSGQKADVRRRPGLTSTGNRVLLAIALGWVAWFATQSIPVGLIVGVVIYLLATLVSRASS